MAMAELFGNRFNRLTAGSETPAAVHTQEQLRTEKDLPAKVPLAKMYN
jgi:hypothetical protein